MGNEKGRMPVRQNESRGCLGYALGLMPVALGGLVTLGIAVGLDAGGVGDKKPTATPDMNSGTLIVTPGLGISTVEPEVQPISTPEPHPDFCEMGGELRRHTISAVNESGDIITGVVAGALNFWSIRETGTHCDEITSFTIVE